MTDFFGYDRQNPGQYIMSSDYAAIYFANSTANTTPADRLGLVQSAAVSYQHRVEPRFEAGSSEMYWLTGQPIGTIAVGRLVGDRGFLDGVRPTAGANAGQLAYKNGVLGTVEFKAGKTNVTQDVLTFGGCVLASAAWSTSSGSLEISEAITIQVAMMESQKLSAAGAAGDVANTIGRVAGVLNNVANIASTGAALANVANDLARVL